jgi:hypothetical protein
MESRLYTALHHQIAHVDFLANAMSGFVGREKHSLTSSGLLPIVFIFDCITFNGCSFLVKRVINKEGMLCSFPES